MNIRRFFGKNSREALNMVRMALGENAVILSNRTVNGGNQIMAFKEEDMDAIVDNESYRRHTPGYESDEPSTLLSVLNKKVDGFHTNQAEPFRGRIDEPVDEVTPVPAEQIASRLAAAMPVQQTPVRTKVESPQTSQQMADMLSEMRSMRSVIESQLTTIAWGNIQQRDPVKSKVLGTLLAAGFSAALSRYLAENLPANMDIDKAMNWIKAILAKNLNTLDNEAEVLDKDGIFALIGPTGVGKTTTTAKLAARYVMKHGTQNLGLITTDAYRVGGHEQLRIYGKILGVMVHAVKDETDLKIALNELKNKRTILIDTVGVSQRDRMVAEQMSMLSNTNTPIKKLLCLNATSTGETLTDVIKAYKGRGLDGCLITKLDEAATIGNALDVIIREKLKLYYAANGQRVPEDIHLANKQYLIQHALKQSPANNRPFQFLNEELPFIMGNTAQPANISKATENSHG
ncbi:flagellar biosynthesis protein FlhF [mine drainage metagenome]|uniref:Flagellar biosynthesis protein FlhF n=1 Tax=mine drainage metagenome TaxID=410659 RepID=A0A1J5S3S1_9ZZZZ